MEAALKGERKALARSWITSDPRRLVGRGHQAGDVLEAWAWDLLEDGDSGLRVSAHLPEHVRNPRGQLFGGFTPVYVDFIALFTVRSRPERAASGLRWLATSSMRVDYFEPIVGPSFIIDSRCEKQRGRTHFVVTRFLQDGDLAVLATTTLRELTSAPGPADRTVQTS